MFKEGLDANPFFTDHEIMILARKETGSIARHGGNVQNSSKKDTTSGVNIYSERFQNVVETPEGNITFVYERDYCWDAADDLDVTVENLSPSIASLPEEEKRLRIRQLVGLDKLRAGYNL